MAASALTLFRTSREWVHRRVETIEVIDERMVRRRLSMDYTLPASYPWTSAPRRNGIRGRFGAKDVTPPEEVVFVPVTWLKRYERQPRLPAGRMHFDVMDENCKSLPLLGARDLDRITAAMLFQFAERQLAKHGLRPDRAIRDALTHVAIYYPPPISLVRALLDDSSDAWQEFRGDPGGRRRQALKLEPAFVDLLCLAARHRLVLVPVAVKPGQRRIVKLAFDEPSALDELPQADDLRSRVAQRWQWLIAQTGWWPRFVVVPLPVIGAAQYHHVQVVSPPNVELTGAQLLATSPSDAESVPVFGRAAPDRDSNYQRAVDGPANRAHLHIDRAHQHQVGILQLGFRAERRGMVTASLVAATLIVLMLVAFAIWPDRLVARASNATSLLLIGPGLVAAFLIRGGEHAMARLLFRCPRLLLATAAIVVFVAAGLAAALAPPMKQSTQMTGLPGSRQSITTTLVGPAGPGLTTSLWILAAISIALWIGIMLSWRFPRPGRHTPPNEPR